MTTASDRTTRRQFLQQTAMAGGGALAAASGLPGGSRSAAGGLLARITEEPEWTPPARPATSCILLWLGGGPCHIDTFDPKRIGDAQTRKPGSYYPAIDTAVEGVQVCEHLSRMAKLLDRCVIVRSVHHEVIDEHAAATNRLHTGRPPTGTTIYPSLGSVVSHQLGPGSEEVPAYVVMGYPSASRGPGFLGAEHGYIYLTDTTAGPAGLQNPFGVDAGRQQRRQELLEKFREQYENRTPGDRRIADYSASSRQGFRLAGPRFMNVFDLSRESDTLRNAYGDEFGQRCLLARRLVESGVRFVEVSFNLNFINGTGWDTHNEGQLKQHVLIDQLDQALATLITDLEKQQRLDSTLIVVAGEFGRPPEFDGRGGRGHHSRAFSVVFAGGGLNSGRVVGVTDELGKEIVERPVSVPDLHASLYHALGINPHEVLYDDVRPVPLTDGGQPVEEMFG